MESAATATVSPRAFVAGSLTFGFGLGGLADGIVLHQLLQWHNLISEQVPRQSQSALQQNLFWDGVFHLGATVILVVGFLLIWRGWERQERATGNLAALGGLTLIGWGGFHVVDQLVFHELLNLHNIREDAQNVALYNWGFLAIGLAIAAGGWLLLRTRGRVGG